jgi:hypothetical protein
MKRSEEELEHLFGQAFALEAMLTHLIWAWAKEQPHPPTALSTYLRPIEESMAELGRGQHGNLAMKAAEETVRGIALELERTLHEEALRRTEREGPVQ